MTGRCCAAATLVASFSVRSDAAPAGRFVRLAIEQGLSQNTVQAVLQDHVGFLWFGTDEGLNRFDGYKFVVFKNDPHDPKSLPDNVVSALFEDSRQRLWVGTEKGLGLFDRQTETFKRVAPILDRVASIIEGRDGTLWVSVQGGGLFLLRSSADSFVSYQPDPRSSKGLATFRVSALLEDHLGRIWVGTRDAGLELFEPGEPFGSFVHHRHDPKDPKSLGHNDVWGLAEDGAGNIWVATYGGGLSVLDHKTLTFHHYQHKAEDPQSLPTDLLTCAFIDRSGRLWVGTDGEGLLQYDSATNRFIRFTYDPSDPTSLSQPVVRSIYEDVQGQIWVGTNAGGVNLLKKARSAFNYFNHNSTDPASLSDPGVASFLEDNQGRIWVGTEGGWLNSFDKSTGTFKRYRFPPGRQGKSAILSLLQDRKGRIWVGTYLGGLARFDPGRGTFTVFKHRTDDAKSLASDDQVWTMAEDSDGALWLGTNTELNRFDPDRGEVTAHFQLPTSGGLSFTGVRSLLFDRLGNLWIGTSGGLNLLRRGSNSFVRFQHDETNADTKTLSNSFVTVVQEDSRGRLWAGTRGGGLNLMDVGTGTFTTYKDFPSNDINGILEESFGRLWISTNRGLSRFDPNTGGIENFDLTNGLQALDFHLGASFKTRDGHMLFGSWAGFYNFAPEDVKPDTFAPAVVLTSFLVNNNLPSLPSALSTLAEVTLSPQDRIFQIEFAALDYSFPRRNEYAYLLEGFGDQWIHQGAKREVTFTNLDPGTYTFRVKATNTDGVWHDGSVASLRIVVLPPFWKTWWFRGLAIGLVVVIVVAMHRHRVRRLTADIEERKRAEAALRQAEEKYRRLFEEDLSADVISTPEGHVLACNPSFVNLFGFSSIEEAMNCNLASLHPGDETWNRFVQMVREHGNLEYYDAELRRRDGSVVNVLANVVGVFDDTGELTELRAYIFDNTEHKRLELQLLQAQKMEAVGRLAGGMAHDFNNWLTPIIGYSELLLQGMGPDDEKRRQVGEISKAGERASALASQLLAFSRKQVLQPRVLEVNKIVADMQEMLARLIGEDIELVTHLDPAIGRVKADPGQVEQVILNLVVNARDAMGRGGKLTIETRNVNLDESYVRHHIGAEAGPCVMLAVSDTGVGMTAETQSHIFEPFFTTKERGKGTGLGLSTVYGIIKQSGGNISVYSEVDKGTTFKIYFPRIDQRPDRSRKPVASPIPQGSETVVLVEDEAMVRDFVSTALGECGYNVIEASDGYEAIRLAQEYPGDIHLLLTDVVMPRMSGPELAERFVILREQTKVLYMSGYTGDAIVQHGILESRMPFLQKPFTPETLARKIRDLLG